MAVFLLLLVFLCTIQNLKQITRLFSHLKMGDNDVGAENVNQDVLAVTTNDSEGSSNPVFLGGSVRSNISSPRSDSSNQQHLMADISKQLKELNGGMQSLNSGMEKLNYQVKYLHYSHFLVIAAIVS
jgi:hypothetical protein